MKQLNVSFKSAKEAEQWMIDARAYPCVRLQGKIVWAWRARRKHTVGTCRGASETVGTHRVPTLFYHWIPLM